ncbi:unnamed protein product [Gongylonema pulchrum]|uniref:Reverse transcriptase n=1 Tax=Gongylonema pulchrum TaxID=637853 RepID=A0A183E614_9BILA|nr:unnamed protein product [Gongylonema pulchrum]
MKVLDNFSPGYSLSISHKAGLGVCSYLDSLLLSSAAFRSLAQSGHSALNLEIAYSSFCGLSNGTATPGHILALKRIQRIRWITLKHPVASKVQALVTFENPAHDDRNVLLPMFITTAKQQIQPLIHLLRHSGHWLKVAIDALNLEIAYSSFCWLSNGTATPEHILALKRIQRIRWTTLKRLMVSKVQALVTFEKYDAASTRLLKNKT